MKQKVVISIEIDKESSYSFGSIECRIYEPLFTDSSYSLQSEKIIAQVKNFVKKFRTFNIITVTLAAGNRNDTYPPVISSFRYVMINHTEKQPEFKRAKMSGNQYMDWTEGKSIKDVYNTIQYLTDEANSKFIEMLRTGVPEVSYTQVN